MDAQFQYGPAQLTTSDETPTSAKASVGEPAFAKASAGEPFSCAVRFGRRKFDPFGHLVLTAAALQFRGGQEIEVPWGDVAAVAHINASLVISLHHTRRTLHFLCHDADEAAHGAAIAQQRLVAQQAHHAAFA